MATDHVWIYRSGVETTTEPENIVGYDVEVTDGSIGKVDEATTHTGHQYLIVDTGFWIFGKKRLIPAGMVISVDHADEQVAVSMTKDQIKQAPDFEADMSVFDDADYDKHSSYYGTYRS